MTGSTPAPASALPEPVPPRQVWLVAGTVLTVIALLLASLAIGSSVRASAARLSTQTEIQHQGYPRPASQVDVDIPDGDVSLAAGDPTRVAIRRELTWSREKPRVTEAWSAGGRLRTTLECASSFPPWVDQVCTVDHAMEVPPDAAAKVRTHTGRIDVRALHGDLRLSSTTGPITVTGVAGTLRARTTTGDITGSGLRSARADAGTTTGAVDLSFDEPPQQVTVEAATGSVTIEVPHGDPYRIRVETTTGAQRLDVIQDPDAVRVIKIRTTTADVHVRYAPLTAPTSDPVLEPDGSPDATQRPHRTMIAMLVKTEAGGHPGG